MQPFSLLLGLGALTGLLLAGWQAPKKGTIRYLDAGVWTLFGALLGSRAFTVIVNFTYYQTHPGEIFQVWLGGLSGIGAFTGGIVAIGIITIWLRFPLGTLADTLLPLAGTLTVTAWLGCWVDRCSYGMPSAAWWALPGRDEWGVLENRVPVQLMGAMLTLVFIWLLAQASKRFPAPGMSAAIGLFWLSAEILALSFLRADPTPIWHNMRLEAWGAIGLMIFSVVTVVILLFRWNFRKRFIPRVENPVSGR